jgi:deazaflavin-dependent oxidoreductase (nitroreductase family)
MAARRAAGRADDGHGQQVCSSDLSVRRTAAGWHPGSAGPPPQLARTEALFRLSDPGTAATVTSMTSGPSNLPADGQPAAGSGPQTMAFQGLANRMVRGLLRAPLVSRGIGNRLITLYIVGRKSGRHYTVPVAYTRHDGILLIGTPFAWGRNLRTGEPVAVRLKGKRCTADVEVLTDEPGVVEQYAVIARDNHNFAKFNKIGFDQDGTPSPTDLHLAWAAGARVIRLTLR